MVGKGVRLLIDPWRLLGGVMTVGFTFGVFMVEGVVIGGGMVGVMLLFATVLFVVVLGFGIVGGISFLYSGSLTTILGGYSFFSGDIAGGVTDVRFLGASITP